MSADPTPEDHVRGDAPVTAKGDEQGAIGDKYVLTVVLFAAALFLLGIQSRIGVFELGAGLVAVAGLIVVGTTPWVFALPKQWPF